MTPERNDRRPADDAAETLVGIGAKLELAGRAFPAPSAGTIALLDAIGSPFVAETGADEVTMIDLLRALYVLSEREKAALPVLRVRRRQAELKKIFGASAPDGPGALLLADEARKLGEAQADLDDAALKFGDELGAFDFRATVSEFGGYLSLATGFSMLPDGDADEAEKKTADGVSSG